jgi:hypothetical protein
MTGPFLSVNQSAANGTAIGVSSSPTTRATPSLIEFGCQYLCAKARLMIRAWGVGARETPRNAIGRPAIT